MNVSWLRISAGVAVLLGVIFLAIGLDRADKVASVVGGLSAVLALGLTLTTFRSTGESPPRAGVNVTQHGGAPYTNTGIHQGNVTNISIERPPPPQISLGQLVLAALLVAALVFGAVYVLILRKTPADEALELVEAEFSTSTVPIKWVARVEQEPPSGVDQRRPVLVTLRNPTDEPAVLTGVKVVVSQLKTVSGCGATAGGGLTPTLTYPFTFPTTLDPPWDQTNAENFQVAPRSADALSISMGPDSDQGLTYLWRFSIYGVSKAGRLASWADGIAIDAAEVTPTRMHQFVWGEKYPHEGHSREQIRSCAADMVQRVERFIGTAPRLVQPEVRSLLAEYRKAAQP